MNIAYFVCVYLGSKYFLFAPGYHIINGTTWTKNSTLMLADTEAEKNKWVVALAELHRIMKRNNLPNTTVLVARELIDNSLTLLRNTLSAAIIDPDRIVLGTEEGMYCLDLDRTEIAKIGDGKKIFQLEYISEEHLLVVVSGKQRQVRLIRYELWTEMTLNGSRLQKVKGVLFSQLGQY